jgi:hypothetical protein
MIFTCLATFKRLETTPINCWIPAELKRYENYMNMYCWLKGTYYTPENYRLEDIAFSERNVSLLRYYQWVPLILLLQGFLFYLPRILWNFISDKIFGYNLFEIVNATVSCDSYDRSRDRVLAYLIGLLTQNFNDSLTTDRLKQNNRTRSLIKNYTNDNSRNQNEEKPESRARVKQILQILRSSSLLFTYFFIKFLYLLIAVAQLYFMNLFLSNKKHTFYGAEILERLYGTDQANGIYADSKVVRNLCLLQKKFKKD